MDPRLDKIIVSKEEIEETCTRAVDWINTTYKNRSFIMLGILKGCIPFIGKIIDRIESDMTLDFMAVSSFQTGGAARDTLHPKIVMDLINDVKGMDILIVEDIIDTGRSLKAIVDLLKMRGANEIKICCLFDRKCKRSVDLVTDFSGIYVPEASFLVGFGLDFYGYMRNLPFVATLSKEAIKLGPKIFEKDK